MASRTHNTSHYRWDQEHGFGQHSKGKDSDPAWPQAGVSAQHVSVSATMASAETELGFPGAGWPQGRLKSLNGRWGLSPSTHLAGHIDGRLRPCPEEAGRAKRQKGPHSCGPQQEAPQMEGSSDRVVPLKVPCKVAGLLVGGPWPEGEVVTR